MRFCWVLLLWAGACGEAQQAPAPAGPRRVVATTPVLAAWARTMVGPEVVVSCPVPEHGEPGAWRPDRTELVALRGADLIALHGAGLEGWSGAVALPASRTVDTSRPLRGRFLEIEEAFSHSHGGQGEHTHRGIDPFTHLDPELAVLQLGALAAALADRFPEQRAVIEAGRSGIEEGLGRLAAALRALGPLPPGEVLFSDRGSYSYLARFGGWQVVDLDLDPAAAPDDGVRNRVIRLTTERRGRLFLCARTPAPALAALLAERELAVVVLPPWAEQPAPIADRLRPHWR